MIIAVNIYPENPTDCKWETLDEDVLQKMPGVPLRQAAIFLIPFANLEYLLTIPRV